MELSFGEQIKILLNRKHMTIKDLADLYTQSTGQPMSRQNLTQRLKRDNFPEQDMYTIAGLLGYRVSIRLEPADRIASEYAWPQAARELPPHMAQPLPSLTWKMKRMLQYLQCPRLHPRHFLKRIQIRILLVLMT